MKTEKNDLLVHLESGEKVYCVRVKKTGIATVVATQDEYESAKARLIHDAMTDPASVRGGICRYIPSTVQMTVQTDSLVSFDVYKKHMNKPEHKKLKAELQKLEAEKQKLIDAFEKTKVALKDVDVRMSDVSKSLISEIQEMKAETLPV